MHALLLVGAKRSQDPVLREDCLHGRGAEAPDELVLQVRLADVEAQPFQPAPVGIQTQPGPLERAPQLALLSCVAETSQADARIVRAVPVQEAGEGMRATDRYDRNV